ncbi:MAG: hypothetical protein Q7S26_04350 [bacterium]|nr:hypothetical protein [bacterium]
MARGKKKKDALEGLKDTLYSRNPPAGGGPDIHPDIRTPLPHSLAEAPVAWSVVKENLNTPPTPLTLNSMSTTGNKKKHRSFASKFFIASMFFFLCAAAAAAYMFFIGGNTISPQNIDLQIVAPSLVDGGKQATLQILINNRNTAPLQLVDLIIDYPPGTRDAADQSKSLSHERQSIGTIASGEQVKRAVSAIFYGQEGSPQKVSVTLEYMLVGSNAIFQKQAEADITLGSSPVSILVAAPSEVISGQQFAVDITVQSNATTPIRNVVLQGQYPFGFTVAQATPTPAPGGTLWRLGTLAPGASQTIHLTATIDGQDGDQRVLSFSAGQDAGQTDTQIKVPFLTVPQTFVVRQAFITAAIAVGDQTGKSITIAPGRPVQGTITWTNNLPDSVANVQLTLTLQGPMLDQKAISSDNGFYQSAYSTITWTKDQNSTLALVPPGGTGTLQFSFATLAPGVGGTVYSNPTIDLNVEVVGERQGEVGVPEAVSSAARTQVMLTSAVKLTAQAQHFSGAFANQGPMPPKPEQNTSYAVLWTVSNSSNTIGGATVAAVLPPYVTFVAAQSGSGITYNSGSRTVTWNVGDLKAGVGYTSVARLGAFQVTLLPSTSQIGSSPALTGVATLSGQDRFAQVTVSATADAPTTALVGDTGFTTGMEKVVPK